MATGTSLTRPGNQGHTGATIGNFGGCGDHVHFQRQTSATRSGNSISVSFSDVGSNPLNGANYNSGSTEVSTCCRSSLPIRRNGRPSGSTRDNESVVDAPETLQGSHHEWVHPLDNVNLKPVTRPLAAENCSKLPRAIRSDGAARPLSQAQRLQARQQGGQEILVGGLRDSLSSYLDIWIQSARFTSSARS